MAKKIVQQVTIIDDLTGDELTEDQAVEVHYGWNGVSYRADLSKSNADKLEKLLRPYVESGQRVSGGRGRPAGGTRRRTASSASSDMSKEQREAVRSWANQNGYTVGDRGRIKAEIVEAFEAAHQSSPAFSESAST